MTVQSAPPTPSVAAAGAERRWDIDWLRVIAVALLIAYHATRPFGAAPWHIRNGELNGAIDAFGRFLTIWRLPLLFLLSGSGAFFALRRRTGWQFTRDRCIRLFIPFVVGILIVVPPQVYLERISIGVATRQSPIDFDGSFFQFYPQAFTGLYPNGNLSMHHLWFLALLGIYSLLALPLLLFLRRETGRRAIRRLGAALTGGAGIFLLAAPQIVIAVLLPSVLTQYFSLFLYGYILVVDPRFGQALSRNRRTALVVGLLTTPALLAPIPFDALVGGAPVLAHVVQATLRAVNAWCLLVAILGYARTYLNRSGAALRYASEIVYPFYIWHQLVVVVVAYVVVQWPAASLIKYLVICVASLAGTLALCEAVKQTNVTRFLFGMKPKATPVRASPLDSTGRLDAPGRPAQG